MAGFEVSASPAILGKKDHDIDNCFAESASLVTFWRAETCDERASPISSLVKNMGP